MARLAVLMTVLLALAGFVACGSSASDAPAVVPATTEAVTAPQPTASVADPVVTEPVPSAEIIIVTDTLPEELDPLRLKANSDKRNHVFTFDALRNLGPDGH